MKSERLALRNTDSPFAFGLPALYMVAFLSGISLGLFNPFISTLMAEHQVNDIWIGANSTFYFFVIAIGTPIVAKILRQIGLRRTMMSGFVLMAISAPLFPLTNQLTVWFVIRGVMGLAVCLYLISGQTALNYFCNDKNRAIVNGLDALAFSVGFGISPVLGSMVYKISPVITFAMGGVLVLSGVVVVYFGLPERNIEFQTLRFNIINKLTVPLQGAFAYGFSVATFVSLYPLYLLEQNYGVERMGQIFGLFMLGGLLATIPITHLADRYGKIKLLLLSVFCVVLSLIALSWVQNPSLVPIFAFICGASMTPVFPLSLALIGANLSVHELSSGSALFTSIYSAGCTAGPLFSALMMSAFGDHYIFSLMVVMFAVFLIYLSRVKQRTKKGEKLVC